MGSGGATMTIYGDNGQVAANSSWSLADVYLGAETGQSSMVQGAFAPPSSTPTGLQSLNVYSGPGVIPVSSPPPSAGTASGGIGATPVPVPEPAEAGLFSLGLLLIGGAEALHRCCRQHAPRLAAA